MLRRAALLKEIAAVVMPGHDLVRRPDQFKEEHVGEVHCVDTTFDCCAMSAAYLDGVMACAATHTPPPEAATREAQDRYIESIYRDARYLTDEAKKKELADWSVKKDAPVQSGNLAGRGYPDPAVFGLVDELNQLQGVCTLQSCAGHDGQPGNLWIWLDREMSARFDFRAFDLASLSGVEEVSRCYKNWGQEIVAVIFHPDCGRDLLQFFQRLSLGSGPTAQASCSIGERVDPDLMQVRQDDPSSSTPPAASAAPAPTTEKRWHRWRVPGTNSYSEWDVCAGEAERVAHGDYRVWQHHTGPTPPPDSGEGEKDYMPETLERLRQDVPQSFLEVVAYCTSGVEPPSDEHNLFLWDGNYGDIWRAAVEAAAPAAEKKAREKREHRWKYRVSDEWSEWVTCDCDPSRPISGLRYQHRPATAAEARPEQTGEERCALVPCDRFRDHPIHKRAHGHPFTPGQRVGKP